jgi:hypothetical protein
MTRRAALEARAEAVLGGLGRATESILASRPRKLEANPDVTDKELRQCGQAKHRKLADMPALFSISIEVESDDRRGELPPGGL